MSNKKLNNIIFSGGAFKGWAYIGTIKALYEYVPFKNIEHIIGVSIGAVFGLCYLLQIEYSFIFDYFINLEANELFDINLDSFFKRFYF